MTTFDSFQHYVHKSRYARWLPEKNRREHWPETVERLCRWWQSKYPDTFPYDDIYQAIVNMDIMPSMRSLMTAGPALDRDNIAGYNCAYLPVIDPHCFDEAMYILMCGTGVGYSVERQYVQRLPIIPDKLEDSDAVIVVADSKHGWARALRHLLSDLYTGIVPKWDLSRVRPKGARLRTFGGRASGPEPLNDLFVFAVTLFQRAKGRRLTSAECSDLMCKIADVVVVGGVRRSALICLSNLSDERMRNYKNGQWWVDEPQRALANISAVYTDEMPDMATFMSEWKALYDSKSGERGIFNRVSSQMQAASTGRRETGAEFGTNPCGEIILRPFEFCNLTEVVVRRGDTIDDLARKVRLATILGTFQSTLTDFKYIRKQWATNCAEERLLGVSMTGIMDHEVLSRPDNPELSLWLEALRNEAISINADWAEKLGINQSVSITTVKPSGTVSQLVNSASGIHPRYAEHYIRTVRSDKKDPLAQFLSDVGVPAETSVTKESDVVFSFPQKSPAQCITRLDMGALEQLEHYLIFKRHWCEHNPSITVYVKEHEWMEVGAWVYKHINEIGGVSFLPFSDHVYAQAPYQEINEKQYNEAIAAFPEIDWTLFDHYESDDSTIDMKELACVAGSCEYV